MQKIEARPRPARGWTLWVVVAAVGLGGCGGSSNPQTNLPTGTPTETSATATIPSSPTAPAATATTATAAATPTATATAAATATATATETKAADTPTPSLADLCAGGTRCITLEPSANDQENVLAALIDAQLGDVIVLRRGSYHFSGPLSLTVDDVTVRGEGMDKTILSFRDNTTGGEGMLVMASHFTIENLALEDGPGDLLKVIGADGLTIRGVRAEWTNGADADNGAYGLYPVDCKNVLIEDSVVRGASDAGFYVGQSRNIILRRNLAELNVAGIEIENSYDADVFENTAIHNTGGILVFNLPNLAIKDGQRTRVFHNDIRDNNTLNFAPAGNTVAAVPTGTGVMIMANDRVEVFENQFSGNDTEQILVISFNTAEKFGTFKNTDPIFDPYPESIYILDNTYSGGGTHPAEGSGTFLLAAHNNMLPLPDIILDGDQNPDRLVDGVLPDALRTCVQESEATYMNLHGLTSATFDIGESSCTLDRLPEVIIPGVNDGSPTPTRVPVGETPTPTPGSGSAETRCQISGGTGVNFDPSQPACELLSSYRFFLGDGSAQKPNAGVVPYDLNTTLFSDFALKHRFVWLPPGTSAVYDESQTFDFPVGTVIIKTFAYPADFRDLSLGQRLIETRLLTRREHGWVGLPYVWNDDQTEARLQVVGADRPVSWIDAAGAPRDIEYHVPNANQCKECHSEAAGVMRPVGPKARNLNRDYGYAGGTENQLAHWTGIGYLSGAPDPAEAPRAAVFSDPNSGTLEQRARAYLDVNCGNCHNPSGFAHTTGLYLNIQESDPAQLGVCKSPVAAGKGSGGFSFDIDPGHADQSILTFRMRSTEPGIAMPELGRQTVDDEAVAVISEWIDSLQGSCSSP